MNKVIMIGYLTGDPKVFQQNVGNLIVNFDIAISEVYKTRDGERKQETCFINVKCFNRLAEISRDFLTKGKKVLVEGKLKFEQWTDNEGNNRNKHVIYANKVEILTQKDNQREGSNDSFNSYQNKPNNQVSYNELLSKSNKIALDNLDTKIHHNGNTELSHLIDYFIVDKSELSKKVTITFNGSLENYEKCKENWANIIHELMQKHDFNQRDYTLEIKKEFKEDGGSDEIPF